MLHNINSRVAKCPLCSSRIYKPDGCNHMGCSRCGGAFCWICRRDITEAHYNHFSPDNLFGCNGMTEIPQCIICWIILLLIMIIVSPIAVSVKMGNYLGKHVISKLMSNSINNAFGSEREVWIIMILVFGKGLIYFPIVLIMTAVMWPPVFVYKVYVLLGIIVRNFLCCCCLVWDVWFSFWWRNMYWNTIKANIFS